MEKTGPHCNGAIPPCQSNWQNVLVLNVQYRVRSDVVAPSETPRKESSTFCQFRVVEHAGTLLENKVACRHTVSHELRRVQKTNVPFTHRSRHKVLCSVRRREQKMLEQMLAKPSPGFSCVSVVISPLPPPCVRSNKIYLLARTET